MQEQKGNDHFVVVADDAEDAEDDVVTFSHGQKAKQQ